LLDLPALLIARREELPRAAMGFKGERSCRKNIRCSFLNGRR
jgi:hypothetical protein